MMNMKEMICAAGAVAMLAGCVSYSGAVLPADELTDESNQAYAMRAKKSFDARMKAPPRSVVVTEAPGLALFLGQKTWFARHPLANDLGVRKEAALAFKSALRDHVSRIKDFRLVDEAQAMVAVGDELPSAANYRMTYNITSLELKEDASDNFSSGLAGCAIGGAVSGFAGGAIGGAVGQTVANQKSWDGVATVEIRLFKPDGVTSIFNFTGTGVYNGTVDATSPVDKTFLIEAVKLAADDAMKQYVQKFGPPIYVTETCQGGQFAHLNLGSRMGIQSGMTVEFYQNALRKGLDGQDEEVQKVVARGTIGAYGAPVEPNGAWAVVEGFKPEQRVVYRWTSARILPSVK